MIDDKNIYLEDHEKALRIIDHIEKVSHMLRHPLPNEEEDNKRREELCKIQRSLIVSMADDIILKASEEIVP